MTGVLDSFPARLRPIIADTVQRLGVRTGYEYFAALRFVEGPNELVRRLAELIPDRAFFVAGISERPGQPGEWFIVLLKREADLRHIAAIAPNFTYHSSPPVPVERPRLSAADLRRMFAETNIRSQHDLR